MFKGNAKDMTNPFIQDWIFCVKNILEANIAPAPKGAARL